MPLPTSARRPEDRHVRRRGGDLRAQRDDVGAAGLLKASNTGQETGSASSGAERRRQHARVTARERRQRGAGHQRHQKDESARKRAPCTCSRATAPRGRSRPTSRAGNEAFDEFGNSVSMSRDGRPFVVGARGEDSGEGASTEPGRQFGRRVRRGIRLYPLTPARHSSVDASAVVVGAVRAVCSPPPACRRRTDVGAPQDAVPPPPVAPDTVTRDDRGHATVRAVRLNAPLRLDGRLDEEIYGSVPPDRRLHPAAPGRGRARRPNPPTSGFSLTTTISTSRRAATTARPIASPPTSCAATTETSVSQRQLQRRPRHLSRPAQRLLLPDQPDRRAARPGDHRRHVQRQLEHCLGREDVALRRRLHASR